MNLASRLIMVEGLCGTGKSTLAKRLADALAERSVPVRFFDEGAPGHPTILNFHAYVTDREFADLCASFPDEAEAIKGLAIREEGYSLIPYRDVEAFKKNKPLQAFLSERELCWTNDPAAPIAAFSDAVIKHWGRFAARAAKENCLYVVEGVFLQHPIHDLVRNYQASEDRIAGHILGVADAIEALNPMLLYLSQSDVRAQQTRIAAIREKAHYAQEESILRMIERKRIETRLIESLPFPAHIIENDGADWNRVFELMRKRAEPHIYAE